MSDWLIPCSRFVKSLPEAMKSFNDSRIQEPNMVHFSRRSVTGFLTSWHRKPTLCQVENHVTVGTFSSTDGTALFFADAGIGRCGIPCWGSTNGKCFYEACGGTPRNIGGILVWYVKALEALVKIKNNCFVTALIRTMYMQTQGPKAFE